MKKNVLVIVVCLTGLMASAQAWSDDFQFGIKGGLNASTVTGDDFDSPDGRTSFYVGLLAEAPLSERVSLQPEVLYSSQGFKLSGDNDAEFQVDYLQVPVLLKIYLIDGLNIQAGPQFGFKVNEEVDFEPTEDDGDFETDAIKDNDIGITAGAEYKFGQSFFLQARYSYGFSEMVEDYDVHNAVFSAGIGFMF